MCVDNGHATAHCLLWATGLMRTALVTFCAQGNLQDPLRPFSIETLNSKGKEVCNLVLLPL